MIWYVQIFLMHVKCNLFACEKNKTTDHQQASSTVAKSFLATMWKHVRFNWKLFLGNVMEPRTMLRWVFVYQHMALVFHLLICDRL